MGNVIDLEKLQHARELLDSAIKANPDVLKRLTMEDVEMAYQREIDTIVLSVRMDRKLVDRSGGASPFWLRPQLRDPRNADLHS